MCNPGVLASYIEALRDRAASPPFFELLGLEIADLAPGRSILRIRFRPDLSQPAGIMHGGVLASLIDTGIAHAILPHDGAGIRSIRS